MAFEVKGVPILAEEVEVLRELRDQIELQQGKQIFRKIKRSGDNIMVCCPIHNDGQERKPSCGITTKPIKGKPAGTVHCFACGYVDTLEGMISKLFGKEGTAFGENWLLENFVTGDLYERPSLISDGRQTPVKTTVNYVTENELAQYRFYHPYMWQRKLTPEIVEKYDVGYQKDFRFEYEDNGVKKFLPPQEVLTFPVKDKYGNCLFVSRRAIHGKTFYLPLNLEKPVYGIYELPPDCKDVVICESVFNALTCVAYGRPAVALFGTGDKLQYEVLKSLPIRHYILGLDPDSAGEKGCNKLIWNLKRDKILTKLLVPAGKDINDLSYEEFINLKEVYV